MVPIRVRGEGEFRELSLVVLYLEKLRSNVRSISTASSVWLVACPKEVLFFFIMVSIYFGCAGSLWLCRLCGVWGFSFWWLLLVVEKVPGLLGSSSCCSWTLEHRFTSCRGGA